MGKGQQMSIDVEIPSSKIPGVCDFRTSGRQTRVVCITLFAALLSFVITQSYFSFTSSDAASEATSFFDEHPPPTESQRDDAPAFAPLQSNKNESETGSEPIFSEEAGGNMTSTSGDEEAKSNVTSVQSPANGPSSGNGANFTSPPLNSPEESEEKSGEIVMEGAESPSGMIHQEVCDLEHGSWIPDKQPPLYSSTTCKYIQDLQNCHKNGRPDDGYLFWKWKPERCELPRINAAAFLNAMRNRSVVFAGDSIARNQFQSLLCVLSQVEDPKHTYWSEDGRNNIHHFQSFNFTLSVRWSPYLVRIEEKMVTWPDNHTENVRHVYLDEPDEMWVKAAVGADILQLSTGQWWYQKARYHEKNVSLGCHGLPHCDKKIGFPDPYLWALAHVFRGSVKIPGFTGTVAYRSFSPEHFENGNWDTGGECVRTTPGGVPMSYDTGHMFAIQKKSFKNVTDGLEGKDKERMKLLDITDLAQMRADGHPNKYRTEAQKRAESKGNYTPNDCLHWCLPGPIDTWNDLLVQSLRDVIFT